MSNTAPLLDQILKNSAFACQMKFQAQLEAAIASGDASVIADLAEELVQETCPRQLWSLVAHLMYRASQQTHTKEAVHG